MNWSMADAPARTRVKICCIRSQAEADLVVRLGADAIGLVSAMPSGPGVISEELIAVIAQSVPPWVATFLLTSVTEADAVMEQHHRCRTTAIQLVDHFSPSELRRLRQLLPDTRLVQVVHVRDESSVLEASEVTPYVDALLLDSGNPGATVKELGGTGRTHDWSLSARIAARAACPVFLAGGLNPGNVAAAIATVRPFGIDICTGVRRDDQLCPARVQDLMKVVRPE